METPQQCISKSEQRIQTIFEEDIEELRKFVDDKNINYHKTKAFICFHLAIHFALKELDES